MADVLATRTVVPLHVGEHRWERDSPSSSGLGEPILRGTPESCAHCSSIPAKAEHSAQNSEQAELEPVHCD